ncbi:MAG: hypothetical protein AUG54_01820 [Ktedonobacter sp. 13_1_20CM_4_53_7]|nr:MAG: hypothetical protein AUG54_01820 [Ktedonobacter sp. 13_1_20CM_4_53_7]
MQPNGPPNHTWSYYVALDDVYNREVGQHKDGRQPSLRQRQQDADSAGDKHTYNGDELEDKRQHPQ